MHCVPHGAHAGLRARARSSRARDVCPAWIDCGSERRGKAQKKLKLSHGHTHRIRKQQTLAGGSRLGKREPSKANKNRKRGKEAARLANRQTRQQKRTETEDRKGPENARTGNDRKTDRKRTGSKRPERTGIAFRTRARKTGTGPEEAKQQDRKRTGTIVFSIDRPRARPCRRSAPKPFRTVPFSQKPSLVRVIRGPRGVLIRARRSKRGQALHGWLDRPVCWTNLSSGLDGI